MKTKIFYLTIFVLLCQPAYSAPKTIILDGNGWWNRIGPTVCKINNRTCYTNMSSNAYCSSIGDEDCWDEDANCWGKKYICGNALKTSQSDMVLLSKSELSSGNLINNDFDISADDGVCFGMRKIYNNGTMASVNGNRVKVWCKTVDLDGDIEELRTGNILLRGPEPTCETLRQNGIVATQNNTCWGTQYDLQEYHIVCSSGNLKQLVVLNGSEFDDTKNGITETEAKTIFQRMYEKAKQQHNKYFK